MLNKNKSVETYDIFDFPMLFTKCMNTNPLDTFIGPERSSVDWIIQNRLNNKGFLVQTQNDYSIDECTITPVVGFPAKIYLVSGFSFTKKILYDADVKAEDFMIFRGYERNFIIMKDVINQQLQSMYTIFDKDFKLEEKFKGLNLHSLTARSLDSLDIKDEELKKEVAIIRIQYNMIEYLILYLMEDIFDTYRNRMFDFAVNAIDDQNKKIKELLFLKDLIGYAAIYKYLSSVIDSDEYSDDDDIPLNIVHHIVKTSSYILKDDKTESKDFKNVAKIVKYIATELDFNILTATNKLCMLEDYIKSLSVEA